MTYDQHPLSAKFPKLSDSDLCDLATDIKINGQELPGLLLDGKILDGWHRYQACEIAGKKFKAVEFKDGDPIAKVWSLNGSRRHMTKSQSASIVVALDEDRKKGVGRPKINTAPGAVLSSAPEKTVADLAEMAGTSERTIHHAIAAEAAGKGPEVRAGKVSAKKAASSAAKPTPKPKPSPDNKLANRIMALEADLEAKEARVLQLEEALSDYEVLKSEHDTMSRILAETGDKQLKEALATIKKLSALNRTLEERLAGLQGERNMAIKAARRVKK